jgi:hypothetical protein
LTDITEHPTDQGKMYPCAIKDVWFNRIVGYSISDRMKSRIAVDALAWPSLAAVTSRAASFIEILDRDFDPGSSWPPCATTD